jgi:hypothetical protein
VVPENGQFTRNVIKIRYGDLARKFTPAIAAFSQAMTLRALNLIVAGPVSAPADHA